MDSKFKAGDKIRVVGSDRNAYVYAEIVEVVRDFGATSVYYTYRVQWYHHDDSPVYEYQSEEVDDLWELSDKCPVVLDYERPSLPGGIDSVISDEGVCYHNWVSYQGLIESYDFCEKCDKKRAT